MKHYTPRIVCMALLGAAALAFLGSGTARAQSNQFLKADSRAPYVHRINLYDAQQNPIDPKVEKPALYSVKGTCSKCHEYDVVSHGWHFNYAEGKPAGRPGEPWIYLDPTTRTILPLSYRGWKGTYKPSAVGMSDWDFVTNFATHLPGGGVAEPALSSAPATTQPTTQAAAAPVDPKAPGWNVAGKLEVDCMICHAGDNATYNFHERGDQIVRFYNFQWSPAIALGLGSVKTFPPGGAKMLKMRNWTPEKAAAEPTGPMSRMRIEFHYEKERFDEESHTLLNVVRTPDNDRCYYCHSARPAVNRDQFWHSDQDIHTRAGLQCSNCHRNGLDHQTVRGYDTEGKERNDPFVTSLSCRGCHYGTEAEGPAAATLGGRWGAPRPAHVGLPTVHLEKLACTACHSGPWPGAEPETVQTGFSHALGYSRAKREPTDMPRIAQPVFLRGEDGKIAPHRMVWPNFWGYLNGSAVTPIDPTAVAKAASEALPRIGTPPPLGTPARISAQDPKGLEPLTADQITKTLAALAAGKPAGEPVYISGGKLHRLADGKVVSIEHAAAEPYAWPIGHDVRPATQSLGIRGCSDCHSTEGAIYFGKVAALGPVSPEARVVKAMHDMRNEGGTLPTLFAQSFLFRPMLKYISFICSAIVLGVLTLYGLRGLSFIVDRNRNGK